MYKITKEDNMTIFEFEKAEDFQFFAKYYKDKPQMLDQNEVCRELRNLLNNNDTYYISAKYQDNHIRLR